MDHEVNMDGLSLELVRPTTGGVVRISGRDRAGRRWHTVVDPSGLDPRCVRALEHDVAPSCVIKSLSAPVPIAEPERLADISALIAGYFEVRARVLWFLVTHVPGLLLFPGEEQIDPAIDRQRLRRYIKHQLHTIYRTGRLVLAGVRESWPDSVHECFGVEKEEDNADRKD